MSDLRRSLFDNAELLAVGALVLMLAGPPTRIVSSVLDRIQQHQNRELSLTRPIAPAAQFEVHVRQLTEHLEQTNEVVERRTEWIANRQQAIMDRVTKRMAERMQNCPSIRVISGHDDGDR